MTKVIDTDNPLNLAPHILEWLGDDYPKYTPEDYARMEREPGWDGPYDEWMKARQQRG